MIRDVLAKGLSPDGKMRGPEKHGNFPEHVHPNEGPNSGAHIQTHPPGRMQQLAMLLAPFSMEMSRPQKESATLSLHPRRRGTSPRRSIRFV